MCIDRIPKGIPLEVENASIEVLPFLTKKEMQNSVDAQEVRDYK